MSIADQSNQEINLLRRNSLPTSRSRADYGLDTCRVCGDGNAKMHYGVITCFGCKGFFRRTLKRTSEYQCRYNKDCNVDRHERNSCRYCRYKKCIEVGMDPKAVRPDRDATGRHYPNRQRKSKLASEEDAEIDTEWSRKLPVDMRTTLMQLLNIDVTVVSGDCHGDNKPVYPLPIQSMYSLLEDPAILDGKRTEMRFDSFREVESCELPHIAHRNLIAVIDWVDHLFDMIDNQSLDDKLSLVKHAFAPLMIFCYSFMTAKNVKQPDTIALCNYGYVRRDCGDLFEQPYHFGNNLAARSLDELISPLRKMNIKDEEFVLLKAILILNPHVKTLSTDSADAIADLRDRIQETLYHVVRETHPKEVASARFGNLLLFLPVVMVLGTIVMENLQFIASFETMSDTLLKDILKEETTPATNSSSTIAMNGNGIDMRRNSEPRMAHSASSSSIESLAGSSYSSSNGSYPDDFAPLTNSFSSNSLPAAVNQFDVSLNTASSMPNLDQMTDCDPDYNVTLTPDMFSDMRQAMSVAHNMDTTEMPPAAPPVINRQLSPVSPTTERPTFYIESTKHKFAVTTFDSYPTPNGYPMQQNGNGDCQIAMPNGMPMVQHGSYGQPPPQMQAQAQQAQQALTKTNSLPPQYYNYDQNNQYQPQSMEYEENYYR